MKFGDAVADLRLMPGMRGQVRQIIERDRVVTQAGHFSGEVAEILRDPVPLRTAVRAGGKVGERNLRPIDPALFVVPEKWANAVDEE